MGTSKSTGRSSHQSRRVKAHWLSLVLAASGLLLVYNVGVAATLGGDWQRYYLSALFQGYAGLLGIGATGVLITLQLAIQEYGVATRLARMLWRGKARELFTLLGLGSVASAAALGQGETNPAWSLGLLSSLSLLLGLAAGYVGWGFLREFDRLLSPSAVVRDIASEFRDLLHLPGKGSDEDQARIVDEAVTVFQRLAQSVKGEAGFRQAWTGYKDQVVAALPNQRLVQLMMIPVDRFRESPLNLNLDFLAEDIVALAELAVDKAYPSVSAILTTLRGFPRTVASRAVSRQLRESTMGPPLGSGLPLRRRIGRRVLFWVAQGYKAEVVDGSRHGVLTSPGTMEGRVGFDGSGTAEEYLMKALGLSAKLVEAEKATVNRLAK